jgi:hypothetical protein
MKCVMKYYKRAGIYKNSTGSCTYSPEKEEAHSYNWWCFLKRINGVLVFNNYSYSVSTTAHQSRIRSMLSQEGKEIGLFIESPKGLDDLGSALRYYKFKIEEAQEYLKKKGIRATTKENLKLKIKSSRYTMRRILELTNDDLNYLTDINELREVSNEQV